MVYSIKTDLDVAIRKLESIGQARQLRFIVAKSLTKTVQRAQKAEVEEIRRVFDRPTRYTLNSVFIRSATRETLEARVWIKSDAGKGTPADRYLGPQIYGGGRSLKRFEVALQRMHILPQGMAAVPGAAARMDANGNMQRTQIIQILSYFDAFGQQGYRANAGAKGRARRWKGNAKRGVRGFEYFALRQQEGKLLPGIYQRMNYTAGEGARMAHLARGGAKPVLIFVRTPVYARRFKFFEVAERTARDWFGVELEATMQDALRTAR